MLKKTKKTLLISSTLGILATAGTTGLFAHADSAATQQSANVAVTPGSLAASASNITFSSVAVSDIANSNTSAKATAAQLATDDNRGLGAIGWNVTVSVNSLTDSSNKDSLNGSINFAPTSANNSASVNSGATAKIGDPSTIQVVQGSNEGHTITNLDPVMNLNQNTSVVATSYSASINWTINGSTSTSAATSSSN
ncbi:WxL domain-containing protein [Nicoliella spurrieriana]|uniref:WxL domain-containing protein n=1 Tax=Nicoliella spurrieriana TaxID=2925830 RepID=A0A976RRN5_9LACO|nr:WxL domain-containing protein [Nicoliella spurrieriana]UQS86584.1 WxL domain-containing protein [Nicoliella spurrieriana]